MEYIKRDALAYASVAGGSAKASSSSSASTNVSIVISAPVPHGNQKG
ncbi:hypothetical protein P9250_12045 [Caballeronia sp. LP006]|nr:MULTISPECIES: hypothetical protein [unclassified Caballeronia]MDR5801965.1 hypothetical protein [Caballeronia sp. LZ001]MDR5828609.1 hypothetical protein [Caballeronia sp. LP006]